MTNQSPTSVTPDTHQLFILELGESYENLVIGGDEKETITAIKRISSIFNNKPSYEVEFSTPMSVEEASSFLPEGVWKPIRNLTV